MSPSRVPLRAEVAFVVLAVVCGFGVACAPDADDGPADASTVGSCPEPDLRAESEGLTVALAGPVTFVDGQATASPGGHTHTGPLVEEGQPHLHYCLGVANGFADRVDLTAIQVLPGGREEPLGVVESDALRDAFVDPAADGGLEGGDSAVLELLVPADGPVRRLHHRVAYSVETDDGWRDLFLDVTLPSTD
jgi:hypothetical protein